MTSNLSALLIGRTHTLAWALPLLLSKAGFNVDIITSSSLMRYCRSLREFEYIPPYCSLIPAIQQRIKMKYDWVVVTEDVTLQDILQSSLSVEEKLKILPVQKEENFTHLYSKIGLSQALTAGGVNTPSFSIVYHLSEAISEANRLGYPVLIKRNSSGGGKGVFECNSLCDFEKIGKEIFKEAVLIQKKVFGIEIDLSAVYLKENLIHFSYATPEKVCSLFGPSSLRIYRPLSNVEELFFYELDQIGKALGAHGFTNISCIQQLDGRRFYFEADMRPNVWIDFPRFFGEDPSLRIRKWFTKNETLNFPIPALPNQTSQIVIPYFLRLNLWELLFNRYRIWQFIPGGDRNLTIRLIFHEMIFLKIRSFLISLIKFLIPQKYYQLIRSLNRSLRRPRST